MQIKENGETEIKKKRESLKLFKKVICLFGFKTTVKSELSRAK
jgi:hypothetical protein